MTQAAVDYTGFIGTDDTGLHSLRLAVQGMNCANCAFLIENTLNGIDGVQVRANLTEKRLLLRWQGETARGNALAARVRDLGFGVTPVREAPKAEKQQQTDLLRYLAVAGFAAGNLMIFSFALWWSNRGEMGAGTQDLLRWFSAVLALPAVVYAGQPFYRSAWRALSRGHSNMDVPISVAIVLSCAISLFETVTGGAHVFFDSAVMLVFFLLAGRYLDARVRQQTRHAAGDLLELMQGEALVSGRDGGYARMAAADLRPGMRVLLAKGEKLLSDSRAAVDLRVDASALTGESAPRLVAAGEPLLAGMVNLGDSVDVVVERTQDKSVMADILALMQKAEQGNAAYVHLADRISGWYTPVVHGLALLTFIGWRFFGAAGWEDALLAAATVLIVTCPCALALAVPVSQVVAASRLFSRGMLIKSGDALERLDQVDTVIFDKTGTLTQGSLRLEECRGFSAEDLGLIAAMAAQSRHPLSCAIAGVLQPADIALTVQETEGRGLAARWNGEDLRLGSAAFVGATGRENDEGAQVWFARGGRVIGCLRFDDRLYEDAAITLASLGRDYRVVMLTGDTLPTARRVAARLGIDAYYAEVDPAGKYAIVEAEIAEGRKVLMVGDGLNDAPVLSLSHVSMSPASAIHIAQNAADIVYQAQGVFSVAEALSIAKKTQRVVRQNFGMALGYNLVAIPLAMMGLVTPLFAAAAMSASSLVVILNALRLRRA